MKEKFELQQEINDNIKCPTIQLKNFLKAWLASETENSFDDSDSTKEEKMPEMRFGKLLLNFSFVFQTINFNILRLKCTQM